MAMAGIEGVDAIDKRYTNFKVDSSDIFAALAYYSERFPQNEQSLADGLLAAVETDSSTGLGRFVDRITRELTDAARTSLAELQRKESFMPENNSFVISPLGTHQRDGLRSQVIVSFTPIGIDAFKKAAIVASRVWFPQ